MDGNSLSFPARQLSRGVFLLLIPAVLVCSLYGRSPFVSDSKNLLLLYVYSMRVFIIQIENRGESLGGTMLLIGNMMCTLWFAHTSSYAHWPFVLYLISMCVCDREPMFLMYWCPTSCSCLVLINGSPRLPIPDSFADPGWFLWCVLM